MMDNSSMEKPKVFKSKIPMMKAVKASDKVSIVASRIPMMKIAVKPSIELAGDKEKEKEFAPIETSKRLGQASSQSENKKITKTNSNNTDVRLAIAGVRNRNTKTTEGFISNRCTNISSQTVNKKPSAVSTIGYSNRRLTNAAVHIENRKVTESSLANRRCTNISTKSVSKKSSAEANNENKNQNKFTNIKRSEVNRRLTVNNSKLKAPTVNHRNIVNRRITNITKSETKSPLDIDTQNNKQASIAKLQTIKCSNKKTNLKSMQSDVKPLKDTRLNQRSSSSIKTQQKTSVQENDNENLNHFSQQDIEFVADEKFRHQILSGKTLSPSKRPLNNIQCSSIYERPSLYKSSQTPFDINAALKRLEDEGRRMSKIKTTGGHPDLLSSPSRFERPSLYKSSQTPFDINAALKRLEEEGRRVSVMKMSAVSSSKLTMKNQQPSILKAIENVDHASESGRISIIKSNPLCVASPRLDRGPIHQKSPSAYQTVLKRLEELQMKKRVKSSKKVTFNLEASGSSNKVLKSDTVKKRDLKNQRTDNSDENHCLTSKVISKPVSEAHSSTEPSDELKRDLTASHYEAMLLRICSHPKTTSAKDSPNFNNTSIGKQVQSEPPASSLETPAKNDFTPPSTPTLERCAKESSLSALSPVEKMLITAHSAISQSVKPEFQTFKRMSNSIVASSALRSSLYLQRSQAIMESGLRRNTLSRLCTPKPVSLYPRDDKNNDMSPEFMGRRTSCIVANAPISTPMVLRNLAESFEEALGVQDPISPLCRQRLDFDEIDDNAPQHCDSSSESLKRPVKTTIRCINIVDQLTDQECCKIFENAAFSVIFEKRLLNPVAQILSHGDDMHFVPLKIA